MKIEHKTKKELVYNILKDLVIDGKWRPGERKTFSEISELLNVSRSPVAEACKMLEYDGWIIIKPQVGVEAASPTCKEISENYKIRAVLEGLAGVEAIPHLRDNDFEILEKKLSEMIKTEANNDFATFYKVNRTFHEHIYKASNMAHLIKTLDYFWESAMRYRYYYKHLPDVLVDSNNHHKEILSSLKSGNSDLTRSYLEKDSLDFGRKLTYYLERIGI
jgi:DNA-binding GntR family transcriptional regulator